MSVCVSWLQPSRYEYSWVQSGRVDWRMVVEIGPCENDDSTGWVGSELPAIHRPHTVHYRMIVLDELSQCSLQYTDHTQFTTDQIIIILIILEGAQRAQTSAECQHNRIVAVLPGSGRWSRSSPKLNLLVPGPCPTPPRNFVKLHSQLFQLSDGRTDRQTDRQTDQSENITSKNLGGGNDNLYGTVRYLCY